MDLTRGSHFFLYDFVEEVVLPLLSTVVDCTPVPNYSSLWLFLNQVSNFDHAYRKMHQYLKHQISFVKFSKDFFLEHA